MHHNILKIYLAIILLFYLSGCMTNTFTARSNGLGKTNIGAGVVVSPAEPMAYLKPSYGITNNQDIGINLKSSTLLDVIFKLDNEKAIDYLKLPTKTEVSAWHKFAFINKPYEWAAAVESEAGIYGEAKNGRIHGTPYFNSGPIISYRFYNYEWFASSKALFVNHHKNTQKPIVNSAIGITKHFKNNQSFSIAVNVNNKGLPSGEVAGLSLGVQIPYK